MDKDDETTVELAEADVVVDSDLLHWSQLK